MVFNILDIVFLVLAILGCLDKLVLILDGFFDFLGDFVKGIFEFVDENVDIVFWVIIIYMLLKLSGTI